MLLLALLALSCNKYLSAQQPVTVLSYYASDTTRPAMKAYMGVDGNTVVLQAIMDAPSMFTDSTVTLILDSGVTVRLKMKEALYAGGCLGCATASFMIPAEAAPILKTHCLRGIKMQVGGAWVTCCRSFRGFTFFKDNIQ